MLQDRQARSAFLGLKQQSEAFRSQVEGVLTNSSGTMQGNFDVMAAGSGFKRQQAENEQLNAQNEAMQKLAPALNSLWDGTAKAAREYPALTTAIEGGKIAVTTLGAGAGAASVVMSLLSKNAGAAAVALGGVAATGGKSDSLGGWIYDVTHGSETTPAVKRQMSDAPASDQAMKRMVQEGFQQQEVKAQLALTVGFDENGRPTVKQKSLSGMNFDVSTGPMMTH